MMESKKFVKSTLENIYLLFDNIGIRYEYRKNISTHIIEIIPTDFFKTNKCYIDLEIQFEDLFYEKFPNEEILFVSTESLTTINSPEFELTDDCQINHSLATYSAPIIIGVEGAETNIIKAGEYNYALAA